MQVEEKSDGERGDGYKTVLFACAQRGMMWRGGNTGPGITTRAKVGIRNKKKGKKKEKRKRRKRSRRRA